MLCFNHFNVDAAGRCAGCAESFCENCLVEVHGQHYCAACKMMTVKHPPVLETSRFRCQDAQISMIFGMIGGIGVLGFVPLFALVGAGFSIAALAKSATARTTLKRDPRLMGGGMALAATLLGIVNLLVSAVMLIFGLSHTGHPI